LFSTSSHCDAAFVVLVVVGSVQWVMLDTLVATLLMSLSCRAVLAILGWSEAGLSLSVCMHSVPATRGLNSEQVCHVIKHYAHCTRSRRVVQ
jgi:hypothetical protein